MHTVNTSMFHKTINIFNRMISLSHEDDFTFMNFMMNSGRQKPRSGKS